MKIARIAVVAAFVTIGTTAAHRQASATSRDELGLGPTPLAADGLPVIIPPPGSPPPTSAEWNAVKQAVTVRNASAYHCEGKMVREWLRVMCLPSSTSTLRGVQTIRSHGYQAYTLAVSGRADLVVQVVKGRTYVARFTWGPDDSHHDLTVNWPSNAARPMFYFN